MKTAAFFTLFLIWVVPLQGQPVQIGSKAFTESVILGEIATGLVTSQGYEAAHQAELGGSTFLWNGLLAGELDIYPDYTGTLMLEILSTESIANFAELRTTLNEMGIRVTNPLGFNNTYAIGMQRARAEALGILSITDLVDHPDLKGGFSNEFMDRADGWPGLQQAYSLPHREVRGMQHDLAYRALEAGDIDMMDLYSTDAEIDYYDLAVLEDDRMFFPDYQAVILYRDDLRERIPEIDSLLGRLAGTVDETLMTTLNARAKMEQIPEPVVAANFLNTHILQDQTVEAEVASRWHRLWTYTKEHLALVALSLIAAIVVAIPLGILAARHERLGQLILGIVGIIYTIPSLALLVFMIPLLGIGAPPALLALFLYSLLPIVRNTHTGLTDIPGSLLESANALGLTDRARLLRIELPLASRSILAGIKTSAIINIGTATLGALIGAGGYGQPILTGIRLDSTALILEGAIPAALLALVAQVFFEQAEKIIIPRGLRL